MGRTGANERSNLIRLSFHGFWHFNQSSEVHIRGLRVIISPKMSFFEYACNGQTGIESAPQFEYVRRDVTARVEKLYCPTSSPSVQCMGNP
jgi:hypothetical protein